MCVSVLTRLEPASRLNPRRGDECTETSSALYRSCRIGEFKEAGGVRGMEKLLQPKGSRMFDPVTVAFRE